MLYCSALGMLKFRWWSSWELTIRTSPIKRGWGHSDQFSCHVTWIDCVPWVFKGPMVFSILLILDHKCCQSFWILDISRRSEVDITLSVFWKSWIELLSLPLPSIWRLKGRRFFLVPNQPATKWKYFWSIWQCLLWWVILPRTNSENVVKIFWWLRHWRGWRKRQSQHQGNSFKENAPLQGKTQGTIITWEGEGTTGEPFRTSENEQGTLKGGLVLKISNSFLDQRSSSLFVCQVWQPGWSDDNSWQFLAPFQFNKS